jgi:aryl sulfotransferase
MGGIYWLASYPKSGNTWIRAFIHNLRDNNDTAADINDIHTGNIASGRAWLDDVLGFDTADLTHDETDRARHEVYKWSQHDDSISYNKIHGAYVQLPDGTPLIPTEGNLGVLYIVRNPLDIAPSAANHWDCTIDEAITRMAIANAAAKGSATQVRERTLSWSSHVTSWIDASDLRRLVVRYEDLLDRAEEMFKCAAAFLDLSTDPKQLKRAIGFSSYAELRKQEKEQGFRERPPHTRQFFRRGASGTWRDTLSSSQIARIVADHGLVMRRLGYLDENDVPVEIFT